MTVNIAAPLQTVEPGSRLGDIFDLADSIQRKIGINTYNAITASTTQTQAGGTKLRHGISVIATANGSDAVTLPSAMVGSMLVIVNHTGQTIQLFPPVGGTINAASANAAVTIADATTSIYVCASANQYWGGAITNES